MKFYVIWLLATVALFFLTAEAMEWMGRVLVKLHDEEKKDETELE